MSEKKNHKYDAISKILSAPADPREAEQLLTEALAAAMKALEVTAASIAIISRTEAGHLVVRQGERDLLVVLESLEKRMIASLREEFGLERLYSTLNYKGLKSVFSYMIKIGDKTIGAITGLCEGSRNIAAENDFIEIMATALRLLFGQHDQIDAARVEAVKQTSVTINHKINNPLTAVLGNVQLLLMKGENLPDEVRNRLELIEEGSLRIRDVVSRLMKASEARTTEYVDGTSMIDMDESEKDEES